MDLNGQNNSTAQSPQKFHEKTISETKNPYKNIIHSAIFAENNVYFLIVASAVMVIVVVITIIRHRQQKLAVEQKEIEYLRYFHSVLPHSHIYGNLTEKFLKLDRRKISRRNKRKNVNSRITLREQIPNSDKIQGLATILGQFKYKKHSTGTLSKDADVDNEELNSLVETEMVYTDISTRNKLNGTRIAGIDKSLVTDNSLVCQKFRFTVADSEIMPNNSHCVGIHETEGDETSRLKSKINIEETGETTETRKLKEANKHKTDMPCHRVHFKVDDSSLHEHVAEEISVEVIGQELHPNKSKVKPFEQLMESIENIQVTAV